MNDPEAERQLAAMKPEWDRLRAEGVPIDQRPLAADLPWAVQFQAQAEADPTGADMEWCQANRASVTGLDAGEAGEEGKEERPATFGLWPLDRPIQERLLAACRALLQRATPAQVRDLAYLLHALQRLPRVTPEIGAGVELLTHDTDSKVVRQFEINDEEFYLMTCEIVDMGYGPDAESRKVLDVGTHRMRDIIEEGDDFSEWLDLFCEMAEDEGTKIEVHCYLTGEVDLHAEPEPMDWEDNPLLDKMTW